MVSLSRNSKGLGLLLSVLLLSACSITNASDSHGSRKHVSISGSQSLTRLQDAAAEGNPEAEYALGYHYYYGKGVKRDTEAAKAWMQKAAIQGQVQAIEALKLLAADERAGETNVAATQGTATTTEVAAAETASTQEGAGRGASIAPKFAEDRAPTRTRQTASAKPRTQEIKQVAAIESPADPRENFAIKPVAIKPVAKRVSTTRTGGAHKAVTVAAPEHKVEKVTQLAKATPSTSVTTTDKRYGLQLMGGINRTALERFVAKNGLEGRAEIFKSRRGTQDWYILVYGNFASPAEAKRAMANMPSSVAKITPWVKPLRGLTQVAIASTTKTTS